MSASTVTGIAARRPSASTRRGQAAVGEHRRGDPAREVAQLGDRRAGLLARLAHQLGDLGLVVEPLLRPAELHAERDEPRLRAVVQVALDPPQLGGLDVERAAPGAGQHVDALLELRSLPRRGRCQTHEHVRGERGAERRAAARTARSRRSRSAPRRHEDRRRRAARRLGVDRQRPVRLAARRQRAPDHQRGRRAAMASPNQTQTGQKYAARR